MMQRLRSVFLLLAGGWLWLSVPAVASEPVIEAFARLYEGVFEGELSGWENGNLVDVQRDPAGRGIAYVLDDCVVQRAHLDATKERSPRMSVVSFDLKKLDRVRFIAEDADYMTDKTLDPLDPTVTMIMFEGPQFQCGYGMSLDPRLGGFGRQCEDRFQFSVLTDEDRKVAKAAVETLKAACMKDAGAKQQ